MTTEFSIKHCPPAIANGCEPSIGLRLAYADARRNFRLIHGGIEADLATFAPKATPKPAPVLAITIANLRGCKLIAASSENPRKKGTHGWRSMQIIINQPEVVLEAYLAMGGRMNDLRWDLERGHVQVLK